MANNDSYYYVLDLGKAVLSNNESLCLPSGLESENAVNFLLICFKHRLV